MAKEYTKRFTICIFGLILFGFGNFLGAKAGAAGTNAWNTLALGLAGQTGMTYGNGIFIISLVIIVIDIIGKGKMGFGTILNATLIAIFSDWFAVLCPFIPDAPNVVVGAIYTLLGQTILSFATIVYMKPALGCGPRDTLMVIIGRKFPKAPIGVVKFGIEIGALIAGILLGAPFGIGTLLVMVLQASIFQFACKVTKYEPRAITHEDIFDTLKRMFGKA